jgi:hypothetical protein
MKKSIDRIALELACKNIAKFSLCCDACPFTISNSSCDGIAKNCYKFMADHFFALAKAKLKEKI